METPVIILCLFILFKLIQTSAEIYLSYINRRYYLDKNHQAEAKKVLSIDEHDLEKSLAYAADKYYFGLLSSWIQSFATLVFLALGGLGFIEALAIRLTETDGILRGLLFFAMIGVLSTIWGLPFGWFNTFHLEEKHGFNRQTPKGFIGDTLKGLGVGFILGGLILSAVLWIMASTGNLWWLFAWGAMSAFSILTVWLYPTLLAPLFNKFTPVEEGDLKKGIMNLADRIGFKASEIFVMDASKRSSHGNAYFTGMFKDKRIVLFDTLVKSMQSHEIVAVLAHELGHFKLNHIRWQIIRSIGMTGLMFFLLSLCLPMESFYQGFGMRSVSNYGALVVFGLWFGLLDFFLHPLSTFLSRKNEFAADAFAKKVLGSSQDLATALLKLRENSRSVPLTHPLYSSVYHSHPPMLERLKAMGYLQ